MPVPPGHRQQYRSVRLAIPWMNEGSLTDRENGNVEPFIPRDHIPRRLDPSLWEVKVLRVLPSGSRVPRIQGTIIFTPTFLSVAGVEGRRDYRKLLMHHSSSRSCIDYLYSQLL